MKLKTIIKDKGNIMVEKELFSKENGIVILGEFDDLMIEMSREITIYLVEITYLLWIV